MTSKRRDDDINILGDGQGGAFPDITSDGGGHTEITTDGEEVTILSRSAVRPEPATESAEGADQTS